MNQTTIDFDRPIPPSDPNAAGRDANRLTGQNAAILARLRLGPATLQEICDVSGARKHTSRISDIRAAIKPAGFDIHCQCVKGGNSIYTLIAVPQGEST